MTSDALLSPGKKILKNGGTHTTTNLSNERLGLERLNGYWPILLCVKNHQEDLRGHSMWEHFKRCC